MIPGIIAVPGAFLRYVISGGGGGVGGAPMGILLSITLSSGGGGGGNAGAPFGILLSITKPS